MESDHKNECEDENGSVFSSGTVGTWDIEKTKSNAKMESDHKKFMEWFDDVVSKHLLRPRDDWEVTEHETIVEQGGEDFKQSLERIINNMTFNHDFVSKRLLHVLDESTGWTYIELWWMMVLCFEEKVGRGTYSTPKQDEGKEKDREMSERAAKREFDKFTKALDKWMEENLDSQKKNHVKQVTTNFLHAIMIVTANDASLSEKTQRRLKYVLDKSIGRTYDDMLWMTLESFVVMEGTKGTYKRKRAESGNIDQCPVKFSL
jgi:hypothetical protein